MLLSSMDPLGKIAGFTVEMSPPRLDNEGDTQGAFFCYLFFASRFETEFTPRE